jgi:hypothetical protein
VSIEPLETAAQALGPLVEEVVFLGGASIQLWISDPAAPATRATNDVDVISAVTSRVGYYQLAERLRERGFSEASDSPVICRWNHQETGLILDVMPQEEDVLGFSNPWYEHAIETAIERELPSGARILAASPPAIIATKLAAWKGRGRGDLLRSLDLHDVMVLIDGRPELTSELAQEPSAVQVYVAAELKTVMADDYFQYLTESAMQPYGALGGARADRLVELTATLTQALDC